MDAHFVDRLLICSDCQGEFIFTAGEQLFFHDKQFKNDPKRCKPCKARRSGLAGAASGVGVPAAGFARTETRTQCSECGVDTTVPFKPTQGRPVLCRQCFQTKSRVAAAFSSVQNSDSKGYSPAQTATALTEASTNSGGQTLSPAAALLAAISMASASASSSISTATDLASITAPAVQCNSPAAPAPAYAEPSLIEVADTRSTVLLGK